MKIETKRSKIGDLSVLDGAEAAVWWLGQAGFAIRGQDFYLSIDPYISDFLSKKYSGKENPHQRMMAPPISPSEMKPLDYVFCTHAHSDHMDPETLCELAEWSPDCLFIIPRSEANSANASVLPKDRVIGVCAGEKLELKPGLTAMVIPSAHEELAVDENGCHRHLGFVLKLRSASIYHSGDCVPYPGLSEQLSAVLPDIALLPVNGRDKERLSKGIIGNFHLHEAIDLCKAAKIEYLIPHHFGMFEFNTIDSEILETAAAFTISPVILKPEIGTAFLLRV